jgi:hypothetical protein
VSLSLMQRGPSKAIAFGLIHPENRKSSLTTLIVDVRCSLTPSPPQIPIDFLFFPLYQVKVELIGEIHRYIVVEEAMEFVTRRSLSLSFSLTLSLLLSLSLIIFFSRFQRFQSPSSISLVCLCIRISSGHNPHPRSRLPKKESCHALFHAAAHTQQ